MHIKKKEYEIYFDRKTYQGKITIFNGDWDNEDLTYKFSFEVENYIITKCTIDFFEVQIPKKEKIFITKRNIENVLIRLIKHFHKLFS